MPKTYIITSEMATAIRQEMKAAKCVVAQKRMEAVALRGVGKSNHEIAEIKGYHASYVSQLVSDFIKFGIESFEDKRGGANRRNKN